MFFGPIGKPRWSPFSHIGRDIFDFFSEITERNSMTLDRKKYLNVFYHICVFRANLKNQDGRPGLLSVETFSTSPLKPLNEIHRNVTGIKISSPLLSLYFSGPSKKTRRQRLHLIDWYIFDFSCQTDKGNGTKPDRKQDINVLYRFVYSGVTTNNDPRRIMTGESLFYVEKWPPVIILRRKMTPAVG